MTPRKRTKKFEKLVVGALRRLQDIQGSTPKEISDYLSHEYDAPPKEVKKQVRLALRRGVSYGILQRKNGNTYVCNKKFLDQQQQQWRKKGEVVEPCPWMKFKYWRLNQKKKQRQRKRRQKSGGRKSQSRRRRKKRRRKKSKSRKRKKRKRGRSRSQKRKFDSKSDDCLDLLGFNLKKRSKSRKSLVKKRGNRHRTRSRSRKKRGRGCCS